MKIKFYFVLWLTEVCELFSHYVIPDLNSAVTFSIMSDKNKRYLSDISLPYSDVATKKTREGSLNNVTLNNSVMEGVSHQPGAPVCSSTPDTHPPTMLHHLWLPSSVFCQSPAPDTIQRWPTKDSRRCQRIRQTFDQRGGPGLNPADGRTNTGFCARKTKTYVCLSFFSCQAILKWTQDPSQHQLSHIEHPRVIHQQLPQSTHHSIHIDLLSFI